MDEALPPISRQCRHDLLSPVWYKGVHTDVFCVRGCTISVMNFQSNGHILRPSKFLKVWRRRVYFWVPCVYFFWSQRLHLRMCILREPLYGTGVCILLPCAYLCMLPGVPPFIAQVHRGAVRGSSRRRRECRAPGVGADCKAAAGEGRRGRGQPWQGQPGHVKKPTSATLE